MNQEKIMELMKDEDFVKEALTKEKPEEVQAMFEKKGVDLTIKDIKKMGEFLNKVQSGEISQEWVERAANGELSEEELEEVAGGSFILILGLVGIALGVVGSVTAGIYFRTW